MVLFLPAQGFCQGKDHVLVLHSYNKGLTWTDSEDAGIESVLRTRSLKIDVHTEYMDTKLVADEEHYQRFYLFLKHKYDSVVIRVVLCSDDDAYNFAINNRESLFPEASIVFCGVNYFKEPADERLRDVVTGVVEAFDIPTTLRTALRLHPDAAKVIVINDRTTTGLANRKILNEIIPEFQKQVGFVFLEDLTMTELLDKVRAVSPKDVILLLTFNRDRAGKFYTYDDSIAVIAREARAPIYGVWDFYLGKGIVGGMLTSGNDQGRTAAETVLRILDGEKVRDIPVIRQSPNKYKFDYLKMTNFGITPADLPPGSIMINKPVSFYESNKWLVRGGIAGFAGFTLIIVLLLTYIRQQRRADEMLVESENRFRRLSDDALVGIYIIQDASFRYVNPKMAEIFGYDAEEVVDRLDPSVLVFEEDWPTVHGNLLKRLSEEQHSVHYEFRGVRKDKGIIFLEVFGSRAVIQGKTAVIGTLLDITERKRAEEEIRRLNVGLAARAAELDAANKDLEAFNYTVAHDLRQPLNIIALSCQAIMDIYGNIPEECMDYVRDTCNGVEHMSRLIEALLKFSRIGHIELHREKVSLCEPAHEVVKMLKKSEPERQVDFRIADGIAADADANLMRVVLDNLLGNAWKYTGKQEKAVIEFGTADIDGKPVYFVRDNGAGFDKAAADKLFKPFQRLPGAEEFKGSGIGLATVERIIQRHGGRIWAEGEPGKGATFYFTLSAD